MPQDNSSIKLFHKNSPMIGGYTLAVYDDWGYKIRFIHITDQEREIYIHDFGHKMINEEEFFTWWCDIKDCSKCDEGMDENRYTDKEESDEIIF